MADANIPQVLADWFRRRRRALPWRQARRDPYGTWVAETMLQQTRGEAVVPYYQRFLAAFPDVAALGVAEEEEVLRLWAGLGYYRRARFLHRAARQLVAAGAPLPSDAAGWRALPGVGEYTAAAIASLAFDEPVPVVDGNVKRVAARMLALELAADDPALHRAARDWGEQLMAALPAAVLPGELNEALMELGATCCTPRRPDCAACPLAADCRGRARAEDYPAPRRPVEWKDVELQLLLAGRGDRWLLRRRSEGWNPGLWEPPSVAGELAPDEAWAAVGLAGVASREIGVVRHAITRHRIRARVLLAVDAAPSAAVDALLPAAGAPLPAAELRDPEAVPLTALARKALRLVAKAALTAGTLLATMAAPLVAATAPVAVQEEHMPRPVAHVPTVREAPRIDGLLDEEVWLQAGRIDDFTQVRPIEGGPAEPRTEVLLMRDDTHLYLAFICWEPEVGKMVLQNMSRDASLQDEDHVAFSLDTFRDRRNGYYFEVSAAGARGDALIGDSGKRFNKPWDGFWKARTRVLEDRWIAEVAIPFATLAFGEQEIWGANFRRTRGADRSVYHWATPRREIYVSNIKYAGDLTGFRGIPAALGVELKPFFKLRATDQRLVGDSDLLGSGGGELSWRITPQLSASLTIDTDFAETEVDERKVNLDRFPLFFPEKRDFFLEDATLFQFGEQSGFGGGSSTLLPFFSRRIGLLDGVEVPIDYGLRVAGRVGPWDLGVLGVHVGEAPGGLAPEDDLLVFRPSYQVTEDLAVGALLTSGDPAGPSENTVAGGDLRWATDEGLPGTLSMNAFAVWADDEASGGEGLAGGVQGDLRTGDWTVRGKVLGSQPDFRPALGFVRRTGEILYSGGLEYDPYLNSGEVRRLGFSLTPSMWTDLDGRTTTHSVALGLFELEWHDGDRVNLDLTVRGDNPEADFAVADAVVIPAGKYNWADLKTSYSWSSTRPLSGRVELKGGSWYDGDLYSADARLTWRPSPHLRSELEYQEDHGSVPGGDFVVRLERARLDYAFTTDLGWENLLQADNQSDSLGLQSRLHWILEDGRELFVVLGSNWVELDDGSLVGESQDFIVKLVYAVRF